MSASPRIVIIDNDQTTGDFVVLFYWLDWVKKSGLAQYITLKGLIEPFMRICEYSNIFRPGLRNFIQKLSDLKEEGDIDFIAVYTNQSEPEPLSLGRDGNGITVPRLLEGMYNKMADFDVLVDLLLVRPREYNGSAFFVPKQFSRVFSELGIRRRLWNARNALFFDDAPAEYIRDDDVVGAGRAHIKVEPYHACIEAGVLLELCLVTLRLASRSGANKTDISDAIVHLHDALIAYRHAEERRCQRSGGGFGRYTDRLKIYEREYY